MHVAIFADIEGSFGIWRMRQCHTGTAEWQYGRYCLTEDVNAVIGGAFDGGAAEVTVKDTHDSGFNCILNKLTFFPKKYYAVQGLMVFLLRTFRRIKYTIMCYCSLLLIAFTLPSSQRQSKILLSLRTLRLERSGR